MKIILAIFLLLITPLANAEKSPSVLITGATGEFGSAISEQLAKEGNNLILLSRDQEKLQKLKNKFEKDYHVAIEIIKFDFNDSASIEEAIKKVGVVDSMVIIGPRPNLPKTDLPTDAEWNKAFQECFIGPMAVIKQMHNKIRNNGSVVVISGLTSKFYMPSYPNTNVIRVMWSAEVKNLIYYFKNKKVRFNLVSPDVVLTSYHLEKFKEQAKLLNISLEQYIDKHTEDVPLGRIAHVSDVVNLVNFLLSDKSAYINGENIALDGGKNPGY